MRRKEYRPEPVREAPLGWKGAREGGRESASSALEARSNVRGEPAVIGRNEGKVSFPK